VGALETVEDQVEPELALVAVGVAGLQDVLDGQLGTITPISVHTRPYPSILRLPLAVGT
jgi:hypothetical protein